MFQRANDVDEADFVEKAILKAFSKSNPIYVLATDYYLRRNTVQTLANYMQSDIAPWLTTKQCIDRVRWCISLFHAKVYMVLQDEIAKERIKKRNGYERYFKNNLKISYGSVYFRYAREQKAKERVTR
ncbi:hypothetical protein ABLB84_17760 [Xenorhabdus szentirmaii]|uniref:hypothetical protein n=1 Tax=Xenorhabdus szentirmaii TaxID=290112 RepID=UPI0032B818A8